MKMQEQNQLQSFMTNIFSQDKRKCISNNSSRDICISQKCTKSNPYICLKQQCNCRQQHRKCNKIQTSVFIQQISSKKDESINLLQTKINDVTDDLINQISKLRDKLIKEIKGEQIKLQFQNNKIQQILLANLKNNSQLTGALMSKLWNSAQEVNDSEEQLKFKQLMERIQNQTANFKNNKVQQYFNELKSNISNISKNNIQPCWSQSLTSKNHTFNERVVKKIAGGSNYEFSLMEPSLNQMKGKIIKWRVKITNLANWIGVGVCLKQFAKKRNFIWANWTQHDHGSYIISGNTYKWSHQNPTQNCQTCPVGFTTGDIISLQYNKQLRTLRFVRQSNQSQYTLKVVHNQIQSNDEYCICCVLHSVGNEVQLLQLSSQQ